MGRGFEIEDGRAVVRSAFRRAFAPRYSSQSPIEWIESNVYLPKAVAREGLVSLASSRYLIEPIERMTDIGTREINMLFPVRFAKTLAVDLYFFWSIPHRQLPYLHVFQIEPIADAHADQRIWATLLASENRRWFGPYMPRVKTHLKQSSGKFELSGAPYKFSGPSLGQLQSAGFATAVADEIWQYQSGVLSQIRGRIGDYRDMGVSKLICLSQGGGLHSDDWRDQVESGEFADWMPLCVGCRKPMKIAWSGRREDGSKFGFLWDSGDGGNAGHESDDRRAKFRDHERAAATVRFECEHCGQRHENTETERGRWNREGAYYVERNGARIKTRSGVFESITFHVSGGLRNDWAAMVKDFLAGVEKLDGGDASGVVAFVEKTLAEFMEWRDESESDLFRTEVDHVSVSDGVPSWELAVGYTMGIDTQMDHYWAMIEAYSEDGTPMILYADRCETMAELDGVRQRFGIPREFVAQDVAYNTNAVLAQIVLQGEQVGKTWNCWRASLGKSKRDGFERMVGEGKNRRRVSSPWRTVFKDPSFGKTKQHDARLAQFLRNKGVVVFEYDADTFRNSFMGSITRARKSKPGALLIHPTVDAKLFAKHVAGKKRRFNRRRGVWEWDEERSKNDHLFDCGVICRVLATAANLIRSD